LQVFAATGMTPAHAWQLACNSFEASFAPEADKQAWMSRLQSVFSDFSAR
jgi:adenosine deaminase